MGRKKFLISYVFLLICAGTWAKEVTDTLESPQGMSVIVTYNIIQNNGSFDISFINARKVKGTYSGKYNKLNEIAVLFFDRIGHYEDNMQFSGMSADAFMVPKNVTYKASRDGYFLLQDNPTITMELNSTESAELSIPFFLAHYEKKCHYKIFSRCQNLVINLSKRQATNSFGKRASQQTTQTITVEEEVEVNNNDAELAEFLINKIPVLLSEQEDYPFSDELKQTIEELHKIQLRNLSNHSLSAKIDKVLDDCKQKEKVMKANANAAEEAAAKEVELQAKRAEEQAQARQDSIASVARQQAEKNRKQNLLLIIGGVILAILTFVGNQVFQHYRNVKNQKSIMDMQANVVRRAEDEAKRRARNMAQSQINRAKGEVKRNTRNMVSGGMSKIGINKGKGNKGISI